MKSLSILILLGTTTALIIGGLFAVTPVLAETSLESSLQAPHANAPAIQIDPFAPTTGLLEEPQGETNIAAVEEFNTDESSTNNSQEITEGSPQSDVALDPGEVMNSAFTVAFQKEDNPSQDFAVAESNGKSDQAVAAIDLIASLDSFISSVSNGNASQVTGIYVDNVFALNIAQQPSGSPGYISERYGEVTQFGLASEYGSLGLLAHNYLSGNDFFNLSEGETITLVYGDGSSESYRIEQIRSFEALQPDSPYSNFIDLDNGGKLSAADLFYSMYNSDNSLVLQTCIANNGISTWGRVFIIAVPVIS